MATIQELEDHIEGLNVDLHTAKKRNDHTQVNHIIAEIAQADAQLDELLRGAQ
jgi:hypothetical protein